MLMPVPSAQELDIRRPVLNGKFVSAVPTFVQCAGGENANIDAGLGFIWRISV
jgi:hypothetical protein